MLNANSTIVKSTSQQYSIERVLSLLDAKSSPSRGSYLACCPAHDDRKASLEIWEDSTDGHVGLMCYAFCSRKAICDALGIREQDLYHNNKQFKPQAPKEKINLVDLARDKCMPYQFLINLGLTDQKGGGVHIPYYKMGGEIEGFYVRIRTALKAKDGSRWAKGSTVTPYGLDRLADTPTDLITEGESNCWTAWLHKLPALGIPGASMTSKILAEHVALFPPKVYITQDPDNAGKQFVSSVAKRLVELDYQGEILAIDLKASYDVKDLNDLHKKLYTEDRLSDFKAEWQKALDAAVKVDINELLKEEKKDELPSVILGGQLRESRDESLEHLGKSEEQDPTIFVQSGRLVQIGCDKENKAVIMHMGVPEIKNALTKACDFFTLKKVPNTEDEYVTKPASPPKEVAEAILALSPSKWPFKQLEAIVETPIIRPDGTILQTPGYDELTNLYYAPHKDMQECNVPEKPTKREALEAMAVLQDIIADFPFVNQSDMANMLALLITPIIRPAIKRHIPLALIDAPKQGAGKGLLSDITSIIATGDSAPIMPAPKNDEEWDKKITSILMTGATIITLDNLPSRLQSSMLDAVLTADYWVGRILGISKMVKVPHRATWVATGNNIKVGGDLARRCIWIRIDPQTSKPWNRAGFKYEDLATHVKEHRAEIITAILTLVRAWFVAECPQDKYVPALGTFTGWARMVGSILKFTGVDGFLGNLNKLYDEMDEENAQWALFLQAWKDTFGDKAILVKELVAALTEEKKEDAKQEELFTGGSENFTGGCLADFLPDNLQSALQSTKDGKKGSFNIALGKQLEKRVDTCFGDNNLKLKKERDAKSNSTKWSVVTGGTGGTGGNFSRHRTDNFSPSSVDENENAQCKDDSDHFRHFRQDEDSQVGESGINQDEKPTEAPSQSHFDKLFSNQPPVQSPVTRIPNRPCFKCNTQNWRWDEMLETSFCQTCG